MDWIKSGFELFLHLDKHLAEFVHSYGAWTYAVLFVVIFCETGLVVTPFLPGDSLLFAAGALAREGDLNPHYMFALLAVAAILGDTVNYWIGAWIGPRAFTGKIRFLNRRHLDRTHRFFEKYGGKTIILARFVPIVRTFAPFVAGIGAMNYRRFIVYNVVGGLAWVAIFVYGGWLTASNHWVQNHKSVILLAIIAISVLPMAFEVLRAWWVGEENCEAPQDRS